MRGSKACCRPSWREVSAGCAQGDGVAAKGDGAAVAGDSAAKGEAEAGGWALGAVPKGEADAAGTVNGETGAGFAAGAGAAGGKAPPGFAFCAPLRAVAIRPGSFAAGRDTVRGSWGETGT